MQKKLIFSYFFIFMTILVMMSLSRATSDKMRGRSIQFMTPLVEKILSFKHFVTHPAEPSPFQTLSLAERCQSLQLDHQLLTGEVDSLKKLLQEQQQLISQITKVASSNPEAAAELSDDYQKSMQRMIRQLKWRVQALPARVILRSFDTWNSSLWINVGESTNRIHQAPLIGKNSPVIVGNAIVGVVDYVGEYQSRVCLITDQRLTPSVRAARGGEQDLAMGQQVDELLEQLNQKKQISLSKDDYSLLCRLLKQLQQQLKPLNKSLYLAKGELLGRVSLSRRCHDLTLKGTGFNYDFDDEEGGGRDLRSGQSFQDPDEPPISILKIQDILVTTGMDGIFPPGFQVAIVTKVHLLKEGDYFYHLEAKPIVGSLDELSLVFVLPSLSSCMEDMGL